MKDLLVDSALEGELLQQIYRIEKKIGKGGMAWVYKGTHSRLGGLVAVKVLFSQYADDAEVRRRFEQEARIQYRLNHPNIVRVLDFIEERGIFGFVLEWCEGGDLHDWMRHNPSPRSTAQLKEFFLPVLDAVGYAHQQGLVHRDLKGQNILIHDIGDGILPKVADFGIAKVLDSLERTRTGLAMGTLSYMAPEQLQGARDLDSRADIYSLGILLYQFLTGHLPFRKNDPQLLHKLLHQTRTPPPELPEAMQTLLMNCLAINPDDRFSSCNDLKDALLSAMESGEFNAVEDAKVSQVDAQHDSNTPLPLQETQPLKEEGREKDGVHALPTPISSEAKAAVSTELLTSSFPAPTLSTEEREKSNHESSAPTVFLGGRGLSFKMTSMFMGLFLLLLVGGALWLHLRDPSPTRSSLRITPRRSPGPLLRPRSLAPVRVPVHRLPKASVHRPVRSIPQRSDRVSPALSPSPTQHKVRSPLGSSHSSSRHRSKSYSRRSCPWRSKSFCSFWRACRKGDGAGCFQLAERYWRGHKVRVNHRRARRYYTKACALKHSIACFKLASSYEKATGSVKDMEKARSFYTKACELRHVRACLRLASCYEKGVMCVKDVEKTHGFYTKACTLKHSFACFRLANLYSKRKDSAKALGQAHTYYAKACTLKHNIACLMLASCYENGQGTAKHLGKARIYYAKACHFHNKTGCYILAQYYESGRGGAKDSEVARRYYAKSCSSLHKKGCRKTGVLFQYGKDRELVKARHYYRKACGFNDGEGCYLLGYIYRFGEGIAKDLAQAHRLFVQACSLRSAAGCRLLGDNYEEGAGVPKDLRKARRAYTKSCSLRFWPGCRTLADLYVKSKSYVQAAHFYAKACSFGHTPSCITLSDWYKEGDKVKKDCKKARWYSNKLCRQGFEGACSMGCR